MEAPAHAIEYFSTGMVPMHAMYAVWSGDGRRRRSTLHPVTPIGRRIAAGVCAFLARVRTFELRVAATILILYRIYDVEADDRKLLQLPS